MSTISLPICKKREKSDARILDFYSFKVAEQIDDIKDQWNQIQAESYFLSTEYLKAFEMSPAQGITPYYVLVYQGDEIAGFCYFQWKYFHLSENIRNQEEHKNVVLSKLKKVVIEKINFPTLICGNLLLTGENGFCFRKDISFEKQWELVDQAINTLKFYIQSNGKPVGLVIVKDFFQSHKTSTIQQGFSEFQVQPTMLMNLPESWLSFNDYIHSMKSKYRVRLKKARKEMERIQTISFTYEEIREKKNIIFALYQNISNEAAFNTFLLHEDYFENLKKALGDKLAFISYMLDGQMIGFSTTILENGVLHAHFLGYDKQINRDIHLYLNMLYDIVDYGIQTRAKKIDFSRTAIEIKSTVGAVDTPLFFYIKHTGLIWNRLVSPIVSFVKPETNYVIRHPFRDENEA